MNKIKESDFIGPTLEEIRDAYIQDENLSDRDAELNTLIWNQAIAHHAETVAKATEERIIKLLVADRSESHAIDDLIDGIIFQSLSRSEFKRRLFALIKGENK